MARKTTGATKKSAAPRDPEKKLIDAAFGLAAEQGWRDLALSQIAERAGMSLAEAGAIAGNKDRVMCLFRRRLDAETLAGVEPQDAAMPARDRLFDVIMQRLESLQPYRAGLRRILGDSGCDPVAGLCLLIGLRSSLRTLLEAAGLASDGLRGLLRIKALGVVYLCTLRTWMSDESPDMAKTMAHLDRHLGRLDRLAGCCSHLQKKAASAKPA
jgi:hypothetical protein